MYICIYIHMYICVYIYICVHIYISVISQVVQSHLLSVWYMFPLATQMSTKEPYISTKEPYISTKEFYVSANEPCVTTHCFLFSSKTKFVCGTWFNTCDVIRSYTPTVACRNEAKRDWWCCMRREGGVCKWHTYGWVMSHIWMSHACMSESYCTN